MNPDQIKREFLYKIRKKEKKKEVQKDQLGEAFFSSSSEVALLKKRQK